MGHFSERVLTSCKNRLAPVTTDFELSRYAAMQMHDVWGFDSCTQIPLPSVWQIGLSYAGGAAATVHHHFQDHLLTIGEQGCPTATAATSRTRLSGKAPSNI